MAHCYYNVKWAKFLGVTFYDDLTWKPNINEVFIEMTRNVYVISRIRFKIDAITVFKLYDATILWYISYCSIIWATDHNTIKLHKIQLIQKRVPIDVSFLEYWLVQAAKPIFHRRRCWSIFYICKCNFSVLMYCNLQGDTPNLFHKYFKTHSEISLWNVCVFLNYIFTLYNKDARAVTNWCIHNLTQTLR